MKIFHIITSLKIGGAESVLFNFLQKSVNDSNQHYVAYFYYGPNVDRINKLGIKTFYINGFFLKYDFIFYYRLKKIIKNINPDVIHSSLWSANFFTKFISRSLNIPLICSLHSNFEYDGWLRKLLEKPTLFFADKYLAVSESSKKGFIKTFLNSFKNQQKKKILLSKIILIKNGIDFEQIRKKALENKLMRKDLQLNNDDFIIGAVGRLEPIKAYDFLIKSFSTFCNKLINLNFNRKQKVKKNKNIKLCIIGDGSLRGNLEDLAFKLNIKDKILFLGMRNDVYKFYSLFDCFVMTSISEGLSISLLEALSFGLPIITTCIGKQHDVVKHMQNGLLVPPNDHDKLVEALNFLYFNTDILQKMKHNNLNLVEKDFDLNRTKMLYDRLYDGLSRKYNCL